MTPLSLSMVDRLLLAEIAVPMTGDDDFQIAVYINDFRVVISVSVNILSFSYKVLASFGVADCYVGAFFCNLGRSND